MKVPIGHCLSYPHRIATAARRLDLAEVASLTFERPDYSRFPALRIAREALAAGGGLPTVLNASNEIAVENFLAGAIPFSEIARLAVNPTTTSSQTTGPAPTTSAAAAPPPTLSDVINSLRGSAASASHLAMTSSGYRAGLLGSIAAACTASFSVALVFGGSAS